MTGTGATRVAGRFQHFDGVLVEPHELAPPTSPSLLRTPRLMILLMQSPPGCYSPQQKFHGRRTPIGGITLRDFLKKNGILEELEERPMKPVLALQLADLLKENELTKSEMATPALGRKIKIELVPA